MGLGGRGCFQGRCRGETKVSLPWGWGGSPGRLPASLRPFPHPEPQSLRRKGQGAESAQCGASQPAGAQLLLWSAFPDIQVQTEEAGCSPPHPTPPPLPTSHHILCAAGPPTLGGCRAVNGHRAPWAPAGAGWVGLSGRSACFAGRARGSPEPAPRLPPCQGLPTKDPGGQLVAQLGSLVGKCRPVSCYSYNRSAPPE